MAIAHDLALRGLLLHALAVWLAFESYLRSSEVLNLRSFQIVPALVDNVPGSQPGLRHVTVLSHALENELPNKVGEFDLSISLDLPRQHLLGQLLVRRAKMLDPQDLMFPFLYQELATEFQKSAKNMKVHCLRCTLHGLRHGGASHDRRVNARNLAEVQQRGNWRAFASLRRYEKHGRLGIQLQKLPADVLKNIRSLAPRSPMFFVATFNQLYTVPQK